MLGVKRRGETEEEQNVTPRKQRLLHKETESNVFDVWNAEISQITDRSQIELSNRVDKIYNGIGKELESNMFECFAGENDFFLGLLRSCDVKKNIESIIKYLEEYRDHEKLNKTEPIYSEEIFSKLKKHLRNVYIRLMDQKIIKDNKFVIKDWSCLLPILLSSSISDMELSVILENIPTVVMFLIKSLRKFQFNTGKPIFEDSLESINVYKRVLNEYRTMSDLYSRINTMNVDCIVKKIQDPFTLYIKNVLDKIPETKVPYSFVPPKYEEQVSGIMTSKFKLDSGLLNTSSALFMLYGNNISSLGVFGSSFLEKKANLDNLWQLGLFRNQSKVLIMSKNRKKDLFNDNFEMNKFDKFIGSLGYGVSSFDPLSSMNPRPEISKMEANNALRYYISKKVHKRCLKELGQYSKSKLNLFKIPLLNSGNEDEIQSNRILESKDFSEFPSVPNKELKRDKFDADNKKSRKKNSLDVSPLGYLSSIKLKDQSKRELELVVLDMKEISNRSRHLSSIRFEEYGLFWNNKLQKYNDDSVTNFKLIPLRSCTASINHSTKFKSHLYFSRFLLEEVVNSNWRKKIITKNKKYYKLSSLVNGGFLSKAQKESVNKITKIIANNDLWENYSDIVPKMLTRSEKNVNDNELQEWEDCNEEDKFDCEINRISKLPNKGLKSLEFYGKYLKLSNNNYRLISKRCKRMLAKYIFKQYPRFLTQYYKMRKDWRDHSSAETSKRNKNNPNNSSRLQLDIIGYSGNRNVKAQLHNFENLNIKHNPENIGYKDATDPQTKHLIKMEKHEIKETITVLPVFDSDSPLNTVFRFVDFAPESVDKSIDIEWNKEFSFRENQYLNSFPKLLIESLNSNSVLSSSYKSFFLKVIVLINWLIYLLNNTNKSFGGSKGIQKCLDSHFVRGKNDQNKNIRKLREIPTEVCNWILNTFMSKYQNYDLQIRYGFSSAGEKKLFATILWLSNYVLSHTNNLNSSEYKVFKIPEYLPSGDAKPTVDFSILLNEDLHDKFSKKFNTLAFAIGFRSVNPLPKNFRARNHSIPPNVTSVVLSSHPKA
ncbi:hypothetical protein FG386_000222 [Cryptosporidium ryanae]|uniref:uncharacterized protein n=1 Tax=Cryptosporidium ryanae TaxID=515981 RepID=UPI00351A5047|nr:hypothetical protein FG386_000222 [Cryptosporidium ryanae]